MGIDMGLAGLACSHLPCLFGQVLKGQVGQRFLGPVMSWHSRFELLGEWISLDISGQSQGVSNRERSCRFFFVSRTCKSVFFVSELQFWYILMHCFGSLVTRFLMFFGPIRVVFVQTFGAKELNFSGLALFCFISFAYIPQLTGQSGQSGQWISCLAMLNAGSEMAMIKISRAFLKSMELTDSPGDCFRNFDQFHVATWLYMIIMQCFMMLQHPNMLLRTSTLFRTYHYGTARLRDVLYFALGYAGRPPSFA